MSEGVLVFVNGRVEKVDPDHVLESVIDEVVDLLMRGGVIGYPTETVYGLGGNATEARVVERITRLKGRDSGKPLLVLVNGIEDVLPLIRGFSPRVKILMEDFWPGPLTLIFEASSVLPEAISAGTGRLGVRVSPDPVCRALVERLKKPLVSTSANPTGKKPARTASEVLYYFGDGIDLILDGGERKSEIPSTVLDVSGDIPRLLREGSIQREAIEKVMGGVREQESS